MGEGRSDYLTYKKFWQELMAYFPFTLILVYVTANRKLQYVSVIKSIKQYNPGGCNVGITDEDDL
jgi:hypothetical protein